MIATIKDFFTRFIEPGTGAATGGSEHALPIATAALLLAMMRMDGRIADEERVAMADGHLDAHELHLMRKVADLLHIGLADYVPAKERARGAAGQPLAA